MYIIDMLSQNKGNSGARDKDLKTNREKERDKEKNSEKKMK